MCDEITSCVGFLPQDACCQGVTWYLESIGVCCKGDGISRSLLALLHCSRAVKVDAAGLLGLQRSRCLPGGLLCCCCVCFCLHQVLCQPAMWLTGSSSRGLPARRWRLRRPEPQPPPASPEAARTPALPDTAHRHLHIFHPVQPLNTQLLWSSLYSSPQTLSASVKEHNATVPPALRRHRARHLPPCAHSTAQDAEQARRAGALPLLRGSASSLDPQTGHDDQLLDDWGTAE